jgi:hypothetical protein
VLYQNLPKNRYKKGFAKFQRSATPNLTKLQPTFDYGRSTNAVALKNFCDSEDLGPVRMISDMKLSDLGSTLNERHNTSLELQGHTHQTNSVIEMVFDIVHRRLDAKIRIIVFWVCLVVPCIIETMLLKDGVLNVPDSLGRQLRLVAGVTDPGHARSMHHSKTDARGNCFSCTDERILKVVPELSSILIAFVLRFEQDPSFGNVAFQRLEILREMELHSCHHLIGEVGSELLCGPSILGIGRV